MTPRREQSGGSAAFAVIVIAIILVVIGVRQEEHRSTPARQHPPTIPALLARSVLGTYVRPPPEKRNKPDV
jgi:hypothetical protein